MKTSPTVVRSWCRLVRPPNLPTVPGDTVAGFVLASGADGYGDIRLLWAALSAVALYAGGLILNDVADCSVDRVERPDRPLPSGAVPPRAALLAGLLLGAAGVGAASLAGPAALITAGFLFGCVLVYDFLTPRGSVAGLVTMGLCRCVSVRLGAAACEKTIPGDGAAWIAAAGIGLYIVAVSRIAAGETGPRRPGVGRWLPVAVLALTFAALTVCMKLVAWAGLLLALLSLGVVWDLGRRLGPEPKPETIPPLIGGYIRALIPVQAFCCAMVPGWGSGAAALLLCLWPLSALLARRFYAS
jgi:4-hydroxybenzoate polyprenyltransferase